MGTALLSQLLLIYSYFKVKSFLKFLHYLEIEGQSTPYALHKFSS